MGLWDKLKKWLLEGGGAPAQRPPIPSPPAAPAWLPAPPQRQPPPPPVQRENPYVAPELFLDAQELRRRALRINPQRTAWIGRVDTIPPQTDERTALIDRGLILRGLLTEEQIKSIHQVGDQWLVHHEAVRLASQAGEKAGAEAVEKLRAERLARKAAKKQAAAERKARRAAAIARRKAEEIDFLGRGVSEGLADVRSNLEELQRRGLPVLAKPREVAQALGVTLAQLRWLCFHSEAVEKPHYATFKVPKRSGGERLLSAPMPHLARAQEWVLRHILDRLPTEPSAHGFIRGRSTVTNAVPHVGRDIVVNLDLSDFFPSIGFFRVRGVFQAIGYSPAVATVLALLCTNAPRREVELDGRKLFVATGWPALPQGACTSPAISNQVARKLDRRLAGMSAKHGWIYTRYADDLTFSASAGKREDVALLMARVRHIVGEEGFALNPDKGRVQRVSRRQSVTGVVVNRKLSAPREEVRRLRAILHAAGKTGLDAQNREQLPYFRAHLRGRIAYVMMIDRRRGSELMGRLDELEARSGQGAAGRTR